MWKMIHIVAASFLAHSLKDRRKKKKVFGAHHSHTGPCIEPQSCQQVQNSVEFDRKKPTERRG